MRDFPLLSQQAGLWCWAETSEEQPAIPQQQKRQQAKLHEGPLLVLWPLALPVPGESRDTGLFKGLLYYRDKILFPTVMSVDRAHPVSQDMQ